MKSDFLGIKERIVKMGFDLYSAKEIIIRPNKENITFNVHVKFDEGIEIDFPRVHINNFDVDILAEINPCNNHKNTT